MKNIFKNYIRENMYRTFEEYNKKISVVADFINTLKTKLVNLNVRESKKVFLLKNK